MTRNVDLVVECATTRAEDWVRMFGADCYISAEGVAKADFIVRRNEEYRHVEFARRQRRRIGALDVSVVSREDLVLSKLLW